ncbi:MAG TPA: DUF2071 domain-containing protein [Bryobacteraceae bacterium]|jgi:uncharacterized protein YqjF (DUF2071 family)|nr:DUF2071 domain-containing protein [Bryobacteraceae bacterium]
MRAAAILAETWHRPWPLPSGEWILAMRWTDLLFAHWPVPASDIARLLPPGLTVDTFDGSGWLGIIPFRMEQVQLRGAPVLPGQHHFLEMNVRTYVREQHSGDPGVYFFSLDTNNFPSMLGARAWYRLPYYWARMNIAVIRGNIAYNSRRLLSGRPANLFVRYRGAGFAHALPFSKPGSIEHFLTERYALFTFSGGRIIRGDIQHRPWILEPAEAEFAQASVAAAEGFCLPATAPLLHFSESQDILAWPPRIAVPEAKRLIL